MKLNWEKKGQIFKLGDSADWQQTHGQVPYFIDVKGQKKIFFTSRPQRDGSLYVSFIHAVDIEVSSSNAIEIKKLYKEPFLQLGEVGAFDEFGTMPCSLINHPEKDEVWMYYVGWSRKVSAPYDCAVGLAISKDGGQSFNRVSNGPLLGANINDPFVIGCPRVYIFNGKWYLFYLGGIKWLDFDGKKESLYKLKLAVSDDGLNWQRNDRFIVPEKYDNECQTCASVFYLNGLYHMYFTYRYAIDFRNPDRGYRIGYAYSKDLNKWIRDDEQGNFYRSEKGWDSEMVCYPSINKIEDDVFMFYCGNSFGLDGFGYAIMNKS